MLKQQEDGNFLGTHILIELHACNQKLIDDQAYIQQHMEKAVALAGATLVKSVFHQFSPYGISGVVVIEESHFTIHSWPEHNYAAVDLFTCNSGMNHELAYQYLVEKFESKKHDCVVHKRGWVNQNKLSAV